MVPAGHLPAPPVQPAPQLLFTVPSGVQVPCHADLDEQLQPTRLYLMNHIDFKTRKGKGTTGCCYYIGPRGSKTFANEGEATDAALADCAARGVHIMETVNMIGRKRQARNR